MCEVSDQWEECRAWVNERMTDGTMQQRKELVDEYYKINKKLYYEEETE